VENYRKREKNNLQVIMCIVQVAYNMETA